MKSSDILTLLSAGYTKEEIQNMDFSPAESTPVPAPIPVPAQAPVPAPAPVPVVDPGEHEPEQVPAPVAAPVAAPVPAPAPIPAPAPAQVPGMEQVLSQLAQLTSAIQANAIAQSIQPGGPDRVTADDALAEIIRPTFKGRRS